MTTSISRPRRLPLSLVALVLLLATLIALPGCSGCRGGGPTAAQNKKKTGKQGEVDEAEELIKKRTQKREKPKDDFEPLIVRMLPSNDPSPALKQQQLHIKPGHWIALAETAKTNNFDFAGELTTFCEQNAVNEPLVVNDTTSRLWNWCPAMLPKGQSKRLESLVYVPRREKTLRVYSIRSELHALRGGRTEAFASTVSPSLRPYEHILVVLATGSSSPSSYGYFDKLLSVRMPTVETSEGSALRYYYVVRPTVDRTAPLPSHAMAWTTIAYIFWDDLDPAVLTTFQQQALLDWTHWGGQLVISGPNSLDKLKGSFLAPYLPAESTAAAELRQEAFEELNEHFSLERNAALVKQLPQPPKGGSLRRITVSDEQPVIGVNVRMNAGGYEIEGTGGLVVERRVGRGRIAITRFPLTDVRVKQWKNFDGFFNAVLLRRPGRVFKTVGQTQDFDFHWDVPALEAMVEDARLGSTLRYFTRDIGWAKVAESKPDKAVESEETTNSPRPKARAGGPVSGGISNTPVYGAPGFTVNSGDYLQINRVRADTTRQHPDLDDWHFAGYGASPPSDRAPPPGKEMEPMGVASWSDDAAASDAAREILTEAAGIEIPSADFVIKVLAVYLLVLVPINGLLFWLLGKVEWAWITAPIIAIVGAGAVIRLAQLDIGFARSRTEVAVLEMQGGYERAHLTRYTALYTSLSSSYSLSFEDPTAVAAPFPAGKQDESILSITNYTDVSMRRDKGVSLSGVQVSSNSTGMVHSEQMLPLGTNSKTVESLRLVASEAGGFSLSNTTDLVLRDVGVFRRVDKPEDGRPRLEAAYVSRLDSASSAVLQFRPIASGYASWKRVVDSEESPEGDERDSRREVPSVWLDEWNRTPIFSATGSEGDRQAMLGNKARIRLTRLARLAVDQLRLLPGEVRLVGWTDQAVPGLHIRPEAPQNATYTLVLAHLAAGRLPAPRRDKNVAEDYIDPALLENETDPADNLP